MFTLVRGIDFLLLVEVLPTANRVPSVVPSSEKTKKRGWEAGNELYHSILVFFVLLLLFFISVFGYVIL